MHILVFKKIDLPIPRDKIYRRLGYRDGITSLTFKQKKQIEEYTERALSAIGLKAVALRLPIKKRAGKKILLSKGVVFSSKNLSSLLKDCSEVLLMAASSGNKIMSCIKGDLKKGNMVRAVVADAVASEMTDSALDWMSKYFNRQFLRENKSLTAKRFSCGYADFLLENQKKIYRILNLAKIGIKITRDYMLIPEKSVTAVAGIRER